MISLFSCTSKGDGDDSDDDNTDDDNDDSVDDDSADDDDYLPEINENWFYKIIDNKVEDLSLSLDSANIDHLFYYGPFREDVNDILFYASNIDDWQVKQALVDINLIICVSSYLASAVSSNEELHILYAIENEIQPTYELYHSVFVENDLITTRISDTIDHLLGLSMAIDEGNNVHISYYDGPENNRNLIYVNNSSGSWQSEVVDLEVGKNSLSQQSIVKVQNDIIYLSYIRSGNDYYDNELVLAKHNESEWEKIVIADDIGSHSMDVDDAENVYVISYNFASTSVETISYISNSTGEWKSEIVADEYISSPLSLVVDSNSNVHFLHSGMDIWESKVKTMYVNNTSGEWVSEEIMPDYPQIISMAIDGDDKIHVAMNAGSYLVHLTREIEAE